MEITLIYCSYTIAYPIYHGATYDASTTNLSYSLPLPAFCSESSHIDITVSFLSPITPTSTLRQSIPASYITIYVSGNVPVDIYTDVNGQWVSGNRGSKIVWGLDHTALRDTTSGFKTWRGKRAVEQLFTEFQDRAEWGSLYFSAPSGVSHEAGVSARLRQHFAKHGTLQNK